MLKSFIKIIFFLLLAINASIAIAAAYVEPDSTSLNPANNAKPHPNTILTLGSGILDPLCCGTTACSVWNSKGYTDCSPTVFTKAKSTCPVGYQPQLGTAFIDMTVSSGDDSYLVRGIHITPGQPNYSAAGCSSPYNPYNVNCFSILPIQQLPGGGFQLYFDQAYADVPHTSPSPISIQFWVYCFPP